MWVFALSVIRRSRHFELFYFTHLLYVVWFVLAIVHSPSFLLWAGASRPRAPSVICSSRGDRPRSITSGGRSPARISAFRRRSARGATRGRPSCSRARPRRAWAVIARTMRRARSRSTGPSRRHAATATRQHRGGSRRSIRRSRRCRSRRWDCAGNARAASRSAVAEGRDAAENHATEGASDRAAADTAGSADAPP